MTLNAVDSLLARAESLLARLEAVLPHAATAPDWAASVAFRYRRRGGSPRPACWSRCGTWPASACTT